MTISHLLGEIKAVVARWEGVPVVGTAVTDVVDIGEAAVNYIKTNGLADLYKIATAALLADTTGGWSALITTVETQGAAAGISIAKGAGAVALATAQADLIAAGKLMPPAAQAIIAPVSEPPAA